MDGSQQSILRDGNGRFRPGASGNPAGKKPGTRNRATLIRAALDEGEGTSVARIVIDKALGGDAVAARFLLDRLEPKPRGRTIHLDLPDGESAAGDVVALFNSALRALASGEITPAEAVEVSRFLEGRYRVLRAWQLEEKLTRWKDCLPVPGDRFVPEGMTERVVDPLKRPHASSSSPLTPSNTNTPSPPACSNPLIPLPLWERDAQGWRGEAEPYPELGEGCVAARERPDQSRSGRPPRPPHPAPAKLGDASLSLRNPLPRGERGHGKRGEGRASARSTPPHLTTPAALTIPADFTISHDLAAAVRDRILAIPGVREIAEELRLLPESGLHSTCNSAPPAPCPVAPPVAEQQQPAIPTALPKSTAPDVQNGPLVAQYVPPLRPANPADPLALRPLLAPTRPRPRVVHGPGPRLLSRGKRGPSP